jgi:diacylglycerol O-acyltransferase / wax synthase
VTYAHFERLSAMDLSFLAMEDGRAHMHIGSVSIHDAEPLRRPDGGIDFDRILAFVEAQLHKAPRFRQKLEWVPGFGQPVWVDDARFNLLFHVRHSALPPPGDVRQLKRLAGRVLSQEFDRGKPLWEYWFVDGLEGGRFAVISKVHHCIADGISSVAMGNVLVGPDPDYRPPRRRRWLPRPAPSATQLVLGELGHRMGAPLALLRAAARRGRRGAPGEGASWAGLRALVGSAAGALGRGPGTPLQVEIGPHRRFDWTRLPLAEVHAIGAGAGGTVNDVVLALASGALRSFLRRRGVAVGGLDFRAIVPVSVRRESERASLGNRVSGLLVRLPLDEEDPWKRLLRVVETTHELKASGQSRAGELLEQALELLPTQLLIPVFRQAARSGAADIVITNVPGAKVPVYLLGARQLEVYPVVPLVPGQALGIALLSYDQGLFWGLNADWDAVPDLHDLVEDLEAGFEELKAAALPREEASPAGEGARA